jgi:hypothetical protein
MPVRPITITDTTIATAVTAETITFNLYASIRSKHYSRNQDEDANSYGNTITEATTRHGRRWWISYGHDS